jgi:nicotinamidase-related amidase
MSNAALLIIDMQVGNFSNQNPVYKGIELLKKVKSLIKKSRKAQLLICLVQNNGGSGDPDEYGTVGWQIHPSIYPIKKDLLIQKQTPDAFHNTNLQSKLESEGIKKLLIAGLQTEYCIDTTCRRAFSLNFKVILIEDAHSTWDSPILTAKQIINHHNQVLGGWFVKLKKEKEIKF